MQSMKHLLLVEDDQRLVALVRRYLEAAGYAVTVATGVAEARRHLQKHDFDLAILDLMLPDGEGLDLCRELRARYELPTVVVSARGDGADRMLALESGADMYLPKPFEMEELVARVRACLRRGQREEPPAVLVCGNLRLDPVAHRAWVENRPLDLTPKEFDLLAELLAAAGSIRSEKDLLWSVWGYSEEVRTRTLDVHIGRLRLKLGEAGLRGCRIVTRPGIGYGLMAENDEQEREAA